MMQAGDIIGMLGNVPASQLVTHVLHARISHVGLLLCTEPVPLIIESTNPEVRTVPLDVAIANHPRVILYENLLLGPRRRQVIIREACKYSCADYSYLKCAIVGLDRMLDTYWFSQNLWSGINPMCSWFVSQAYRAAGLDFGRPEDSTSPEDIDHFAVTHPQLYQTLVLRDRE